MQTITMDISSKESLLLDIQKNAVSFKSGDTDQRFCLSLYENEQEWNIPSNAVLAVWYSGPGGEGNYSEVDGLSAFAVSGNTVTITPAPEMIAVSGSGFLCLSIHCPDNTKKVLWNLVYTVEGTPAGANPQMGTYFTALSGLIRQAQEAAEAFETDPSLQIGGKAADAAATGQAIGQIAAGLSSFRSMMIHSSTAETPQAMLDRVWSGLPSECNYVILHNNVGVVGSVIGCKATDKYATFIWFNYNNASIYLLKRLNGVWSETPMS